MPTADQDPYWDMARNSASAQAGSSSPSQDAVIWKPDLTLTDITAEERASFKEKLKDITLNRKDVSTFSIRTELPEALVAGMPGALSSFPLQHEGNFLVHVAGIGDVRFAAQLFKKGGQLEVRNSCGATPLLQVCGQMAVMPTPEVRN